MCEAREGLFFWRELRSLRYADCGLWGREAVDAYQHSRRPGGNIGMFPPGRLFVPSVAV